MGCDGATLTGFGFRLAAQLAGEKQQIAVLAEMAGPVRPRSLRITQRTQIL